ncbi:MAG: TVP38/TMEM64 family protein [Anaerolineae bacterium]|nr:TVP38/TMEM64 family protein [Anaerolineae bacterium]
MRNHKARGWLWLTIALATALALGISAALWGWQKPLWAIIRDRSRLQAWVASLGPWGPLATISLNVLQVILAPIPGQFVGVINGYLYGIAAGTLYSLLGLIIGTGMAMALARRFGRPLVERLVPKAQMARWDDITAHQGPWFFFLVFLFPFVPDDITSFLIGLSPLSIPRMLVLVTFGRLPGVFVSCWVGARATTLPWWAWIPLGCGAAGIAWLFWRYQSELENLTVRLIQRLTELLEMME